MQIVNTIWRQERNRRRNKSRGPREHVPSKWEMVQFLKAKGYDADNRDDVWIKTMYGFYNRKSQNLKRSDREWAMWKGTFRPHHRRT